MSTSKEVNIFFPTSILSLQAKWNGSHVGGPEVDGQQNICKFLAKNFWVPGEFLTVNMAAVMTRANRQYLRSHAPTFTPSHSISYPESFGLEQKAWRLWCKIASYSPPNASFWYGKKHKPQFYTCNMNIFNVFIFDLKERYKIVSLNCIIRCFQNTHQISLYSKICTIFISLYSQYCPKLILFRKVPDLLGQLPAVSMPETPRRGGGGWGGQGGVEGGTPLFGLKGQVPLNYRV